MLSRRLMSLIQRYRRQNQLASSNRRPFENSRFAARRLLLEALEDRSLRAVVADDPFVDLIWPTGGNDAKTRVGHSPPTDAAIDINQDLEKVADADEFAPIFATHSGIAILKNDGPGTPEKKSYGRHILITSEEGYSTRVAHLSAFSPRLKTAWDNRVFELFVQKGELIGQVGGRPGTDGAGTSDSPHLHLEYRIGSEVVWPSSSLDGVHATQIYKGEFKAPAPMLLTSDSVPIGPAPTGSTNASGALVAAVRPGDELFVNMKGFDWDEDVEIRIKDAGGNVVGGLLPGTSASAPSRIVHTSMSNTDDLDEAIGQQSPDIPNFAQFPQTGLYYLDGLERGVRNLDIVYPGGANQPIPWTQSNWNGQTTRGGAMPLAIIVSPSAPPSGIADYLAQARASTNGVIVRNRTLVISGNEGNDNFIVARQKGLIPALDRYVVYHTSNGFGRSADDVIPITEAFDAIFVQADGGGDQIDLSGVPEWIGATVDGGEGNDILIGTQGDDFLKGGAGRDLLIGQNGSDWLFGGVDDDTLSGHKFGFEEGNSSVDRLYGETGNDAIYCDANDIGSGGSDRPLSGADGDTIRMLTTPKDHVDTAFAIPGQLTLSPRSTSVRNTFSAKSIGDLFTFATTAHAAEPSTITLHSAATNSSSGIFSRVVVLGSPANDQFDFSESPLPITIFGNGSGSMIGSEFSDTLFGGNDMRGRGGADNLFAFAETITSQDGGEGDDILHASGNGDLLTGGGGSDEFVIGGADTIVDRTPSDYVTQLQARVAQRRQNRLDKLPSYNVPSTTRPPMTPARTSAPKFDLRVSPTTLVQGESFLATVQPLLDETGSWARLELFIDQNQNETFDRDIDLLIGQYRGRTANWRAQLDSASLSVGVYPLHARLLSYDGSISTSRTLDSITVLPASGTPLLPYSLDINPEDALALVPHRNGDVTVPGQKLTGVGHLDIWSLTPHTGGGFAMWTQGATDTVLGLYNAAGQLIAGPSDDDGPGANGELVVTLTTDTTYYLVVAGKNGATGDYELHLTGHNQEVTATIDTPAGAYYGVASAAFSDTHRLDYFQLHAPEGATMLDVFVTPPYQGAVWVRVADEDRNVIGFGELGRPGSRSVLDQLPVTGGQTYYITVYALYGTTGDYTVAADFFPDELGLPGTIDDPYGKESKPIVIQGDGDAVLAAEEIATAFQFQYYLISTNAPDQTFIIETTGSTDLQMALYHGLGQQRLAWDDNSADGVNARFEVTLAERGDHWLVVRGVEGITGAYGVKVSGADQSQGLIAIGGMQNTGERWIPLADNSRTAYAYFVAPEGATTADLRLVPSAGSQVDGWLSIEDPQGNVTIRNLAGVSQTETIVDYPVTAGAKYRVAVYGWSRTIGDSTLYVDLNPDVISSGELAINTLVHGDELNPQVAMNVNSESVVVWQRFPLDENDYDLRGQRFDAQGNPQGAEFAVNPPDNVNQSRPHVGIDQSGRVVVVWENGFGRVFDAQGNGGSVFTVGFAAQAIAVQGDGRFLVMGADGKHIFERPFNADGTPAGSTITLDTAYTAYEPRLAPDGSGGYVASWVHATTSQNTSMAYFQRLNASGIPSTALLRAAPTLTTFHLAESIAVTPSGELAFAIRQDSSLLVQRFHNDNSSFGAPTVVNTLPIDTWSNATVRVKDTSEFVVLWSMPNAAGTNRDVFLRQFDSAGLPATAAELQVNTFGSNDQWFAALASNGQDRFFAVWQSMGQDGWGNGIYGRFLTLPTPVPKPILSAIDNSGAIDDAKIDLGNVLQNAASPTGVVHLTNLGSAVLTGILSLSGPGADAWTFDGDPVLALAPGASRDITLYLATATRGQFSATFSIAHNASDSPHQFQLSGVIVPAPDSLEPNQSASSATTLGVITSWTRNDLTLHNGDDEDWLTFVAPSAGRLDIAASFAASEGDLDFILFDSNGGVLAASASQGDQEAASAIVQAGQPLFLRVYSTGEGANVYSLSLQHTPSNRAPTAISLSKSSIPENEPSGTAVGSFSTTDPDAGDSFTYTLVSGAGSDDNASFTIDGGVLKTAAVFDFEVKDSYTVRVRSTDAGGLFTEEAFAISVTNLFESVPPVLGGITGAAAITYKENAAAALISSLGTVSDSDSPNFDTGTLTIWFSSGGTADERLSIKHTGDGAGKIGVDYGTQTIRYGGVPIATYTGGVGMTPLVITFNASALPTGVQAALRAITFANVSDNPSTAPRTVSFQITDGDGGTSNSQSRTVNVVAANDKPILEASGSSVSFTEAGPPVVVDSGVLISDVDSVDFSTGKLVVKATSGGQSTDRFGINGVGLISVSGNTVSYSGAAIGTFAGSTTLTVTLNSNATPAKVQELARHIVFSSISSAPTMTPRGISFTVSDGDGGTSLGGLGDTVLISVLNDAPVLTLSNATPLIYIENAAPVLIASAATLVDVDLLDFDTGTLTVELTGNGAAGDELSIKHTAPAANKVSVSGNTVSFTNGSLVTYAVATFTGRDEVNPLVITFNTSALKTEVQAVLRAITFASSSDNPSTARRTVSLTLTDGDGGTSNTVVRSVDITLKNDAPVVVDFGPEVSHNLGGSPTLLSATATVTDIDSADFIGGKLTIALTTGKQVGDLIEIEEGNGVSVSSGVVSYNGNAIGTYTGTSTLIVSFNSSFATADAVQALLRQLTFRATGGSTVTRTVTASLTDGDGGTSVTATKQIAVH